MRDTFRPRGTRPPGARRTRPAPGPLRAVPLPSARCLALALSIIFALATPLPLAAQHAAPPVLEFPEPGLDDAAAYADYRTRFHRDAAGNAVQVYLDARSGRVVHVWANALNESAGFTARDPSGRPATVAWGGPGATVSDAGGRRSFEYMLESSAPVELGHFLLGSMRVERDFQYAGLHLRPFDAPPFHPPELGRLIDAVERLDEAEQRAHLALLGAAGPGELRARLMPALSIADVGGEAVLRVEQPYLDGRHRMVLEIAVDRARATLEPTGGGAVVRAREAGPVRFRVRVSTDAPSLAPLTRREIFNADFLRFLDDERAAAERALAVPEAMRGEEERATILRFRRLEREVRAAELLAYREKLMAGMPNYATYFGRDVLMTALMMEPVWTPEMLEHVVASVLRKLSPNGEVSHEEALGGQAIRENAVVYAELVERYLRGAGGDTLLDRAREVLARLGAVRENYRMIDDDYQFPVVAARYLADPSIPAERKRGFLAAPAREDGEPRLALLLRNLEHVARTTAAYTADPEPANLIGFPKRDARHWFSGSWRDSGPGYANGRFAFDVNAVWAPHALAAAESILASLRAMGYDLDDLDRLAPGLGGGRLAAYATRPESLREAVRVWRGAARHFEVTLDVAEVERRVSARLSAMGEAERAHGDRVLRADPLDGKELTFLALALDSAGRPIPVASTDPAMALFLDDVAGEILAGRADVERALRPLRIFELPYPVGLLIDGVGPVATNDAFAGREVWEAFDRDRYHSPATIWGREVNLLLLGLARQIERAVRPDGSVADPALAPFVRTLATTLRRVLDAVEASGLQHAELWSYRIDEEGVHPARYPTSTDIQLWNATDLAVRYRLARLPPLDIVSVRP